MRVLVVHNRYRPTAPSGENEVVDQEVAALAGRGHKVGLFQRHSADIATWSVPRRAVLPVRLLWSEEARRALSEEIVRFAPDVVHVHNTFPLLTPSVLYACRDARIPVVATVHNYKLGCASGELYRDGAVCHDCLGSSRWPALVHACYRGSRAATLPVVAAGALHLRAWQRLVSAYVFISDALRDLLVPLQLPAERSFVRANFVPGPVDPSDGAVPTQHTVVFVGRLDRAKGADLLMQAWDAFRAKRPESSLRLVVAGGGPLEQEIEHWAHGRPEVTFHGRVPRPEVARLLRGARAAVVPSRWEETFGLVVAEAMAAGTAVIASAHGAFPGLIVDGVDGALFPPGATSALAGLLADVDDEPQAWDERGRCAYATYQRRFTMRRSIDRLLDIYRFAVESPLPYA